MDRRASKCGVRFNCLVVVYETYKQQFLTVLRPRYTCLTSRRIGVTRTSALHASQATGSASVRRAYAQT